MLAYLGAPDMRTPIAHALGWPRRMKPLSHLLALTTIAHLTIEPADCTPMRGLGQHTTC